MTRERSYVLIDLWVAANERGALGSPPATANILTNTYSIYDDDVILICLNFREFSKEKERVENRTAFLAERALELAADRSAENYTEWVDVGEQVVAQEQQERSKHFYVELVEVTPIK